MPTPRPALVSRPATAGAARHAGRGLLRACLPTLAAVALLGSPALAQAPLDLRIALVIGNSAYPTAPLANPANDAQAMTEVLKSMGFVVIEARDASREQMLRAIERMSGELKGRHGVGMLYYAGHGLQLDWRNYMVPVDAVLRKADDVAPQAVNVQEVLDAFRSAGNRMNIVVLDACRDNPFPATASAKGLAPMDAPPGTLLAYATAPGNVAEDGDAAGNGLYTRFLVRELRTPEAKIEDVFKRVRLQVRKVSQGRQVPWESTSLEEDFFFDQRTRVAPVRESDRLREARTELDRESVDWNRIKNSQRADDFYAFLQKYPSGVISEQAQSRLDRLQKTGLVVQPGIDGVVRLASGANRFVQGDEYVFDRIDGYTKTAKRRRGVVTFADDERVEVNGGGIVMSQTGDLLRDGFGTREPPQVMVPADLAVGKKWRTAFRITRSPGDSSMDVIDFKVVALEDVAVPAGRFKAYRVESSGQSQPEAGGPTSFVSFTRWIDPATMTSVKTELLNRTNGKITDYFTDVLVSSKFAPREPRR